MEGHLNPRQPRQSLEEFLEGLLLGFYFFFLIVIFIFFIIFLLPPSSFFFCIGARGLLYRRPV